MKRQKRKTSPPTVIRIFACLAIFVVLFHHQSGYGHVPLVVQDEEEEKTESEKDLIERRPFDRIVLDKRNKDTVLEVEELNSKSSLLPSSHQPTEMLQFQLLWDSVNWYQVPWRHVVKVETYAEILLGEVRKKLDDKSANKREENLALAFRLLDRVVGNPKYRNNRRVQEYLREYLYEDARYAFQRDQLTEAWTALDELFFLARDYRPRVEDLTVVSMLSDLISKRMGKMVQDRNYRAAESLMKSIREKYGSTQEKVIAKWQAQIIADAEAAKQESIQYFKEKNGRRVHGAVRKMLNIYPQIEGGQAMFKKVLEEFPLVFIGVTDKAELGNPSSMLSWAERRKGRLYYRGIVEYQQQGQDGGIYRFPHGDIEVAGDWKSMQFVFRNDKGEMAIPPLNAYTLRKRLLDLADADKPDYSPVWAELIKSTYAQNPKVLTVELTQAHVRPEALLQINYKPFDPASPPQPDSFYVPVASAESEDVYRPNPAYKELQNVELPDLVEIFYPNATEQTDALLRGDIDVIDRVFPADIRRLKKNDEIEIKPYTIPTIHVLIPNQRTRHMKSTIFRTAILYGINRSKILFSGILGEQRPTGFKIISGPVPYGVTESDPIGYGYNPRLEPLVADARIGLVQATVSDDQIKMFLKNQNKESEFKPLKDMVFKLCYPANDLARAACASIKLDLEVVGIQTVLEELPVGQTYPADEDFDLLYSEITMQEPLLDVRKILAAEGVAKTDNDAINQAIRFLDTAKNWRDAGPRLHELHNLCYHNSVVLPLWQVVEHYAYRKNLSGVGKKINTLYKNVADWRISTGDEGKEN